MLIAMLCLLPPLACAAVSLPCANAIVSPSACSAGEAVLPGGGLDEFARRLHRRRRASNSTEPVRILVMGNSVARWNKYHTSQTFRRALQAAFPTLHFTTSTGSVEGGFGPSHQLYCGRTSWKSAEIVMVHFAELANTALCGPLLRLPQPHCSADATCHLGRGAAR